MNCKCDKKNHHDKDCNPKIHCSCFTCDCSDRLREETQLKCCWEVNRVNVDRVVFTSPGVCKLIASGTISYECSSASPSGTILVRFWRGDPDASGNRAIQTLRVDEGSCLTFVAQNFNTITVQVPSDTGTVPAQGEICITPNFKIPCN